MKVEVPGHRKGSIFMEDLLFDVVLFENIVSHKAPRLTLASHVGHPAERAVGIVLFL